MIKNIVFDMGNVLIRYNARAYTEKYVADKAEGDFLCEEVFHSIEWIKMDRGILTEEDAIASIVERIPRALQHYVPVLIQNWHTEIPPYAEMEDLVKRLKVNGYRIYLLSNTSARFHEFRVNIPALNYFDGEFISADYGMLKPELTIFRTFYHHFLLDPEECFFVDDLNVNIEAAELTGMKGFVYRGNIQALKDTMKKEGIIL